MLANLVKKDFLLVKKSIMAFLGISILVPLIIIILMRNMTQIQGMGMLVFLYMVILMELSFMQAVATEEEKSPKATALLCAAPYPRKSYVIAKYICYLIFYGVCVAVYSIIAAVYPGLGFLNSIDGLFGGSHPLRDIYSCCDKIRNNKGSSCVYRCYTDCIAWADSHLSGVPSRHEVDSVVHTKYIKRDCTYHSWHCWHRYFPNIYDSIHSHIC